MQYFVVMIDYGRRGREAVVDPEITRREVVARVASGEYRNITFIHEIADRSVDDITESLQPKRICKPDNSITPGICASTKRRSEPAIVGFFVRNPLATGLNDAEGGGERCRVGRIADGPAAR